MPRTPFSEPKLRRTRRLFAIYAVGVAVSIVLWAAASSSAHNRAAENMLRSSQLRVAMIQAELDASFGKLKSVERFFVSSQHVTEEEFRDFTKDYVGPASSIAAIEWAPRSADAEQVAFRSIYIEPAQNARPAIALNHLSDPHRTSAMKAAVEANLPRGTAPLTLRAPESESSAAEDFLVFLPVLSEQRLEQVSGPSDSRVRGFIVGEFRWSTIIQNAVRNVPPGGPAIELVDDSDSDLIVVSFTDSPIAQGPVISEVEPFTITAAGRTYRLRFAWTEAFLGRQELRLPIVVLISALMFFVSAGAFFGTVSKKNDEIRAREREFSQLATSAPIGIYRTDPAGLCVYVNDTWMKMTALSFEQAKGSGWATAVHPEDRDKVFHQWKTALDRGALFSMEFRFLRYDGSVRWVSSEAAPVFDAGGAISGYVGTNADVTERKAAEDAVRESEERLRLLVDGAKGYAIFALDTSGRIRSWNAGAEQNTGYSADEVLGKHFSIFYPPHSGDDSRPDVELRKALENGRYEEEGWRIRKDGTRYWASIVLTPMRDADGSLVGYSKVTRDITAQKEAQDALRENNELLSDARDRAERAVAEVQSYRSALDEHAIVAMTDVSGRIIDVNTLFCRISGYEREELLGQTHAIINSRHHPREFFVELWKTISSGQIWRGEVCNRAKNGSLYWVNTTIVPTFGASGRIERYVAVRTDITDQKNLETELRLATEAAESATRAKTQFLAHMSHEIRTPLTAILGFSEQLRDGLASESDRQSAAEIIERNANHLLEIVNDILDFSKVEAGKLAVHIERCQLSSVMSFIETVFIRRAEEKGLAFRISIDGPVPRFIYTDSLRLKQILLNIVGNAIKFTDTGGVSITVRYHPTAAELSFTVADTGLGLQPDQLSRLFTLFSQADSSTTKRFGGTGLGLVISRRLAHLLNGEISVTSTYGVGSEFTISIGSGNIQNADFEEPAAPSTSEDDAEAPVPRLSGRVLVADDGADNQILIRNLLQRIGIDVETVGNGEEAVRRMESGRFDLILMDVQMPEMDGYAATQTLRARGVTIPIVACTADASEESRQMLKECGCNDVIVKPFIRNEFYRMLSRFFGPFDMAAAESDAQAMEEVLRLFAEALPGRMRELEIAKAECDFALIQRTAHKLGSAGMFGFRAISETALELEEAASAADPERVAALLKKLTELSEKVSISSSPQSSANLLL